MKFIPDVVKTGYMKKLLFVFPIMFLVYACALEQASPSDYNDAFYREQMKIKDKINTLAKTTDIQRQREIVDELMIQSEKSLTRVEEVGSFRGDEQLFKAAMKLFGFYHRMIHEGLDTEPEEISGRLEKWRQALSDEEHEFLKAQGKFAEEYELFL
jgi:hypothetical protein